MNEEQRELWLRPSPYFEGIECPEIDSLYVPPVILSKDVFDQLVDAIKGAGDFKMTIEREA